MLKHFITPVCIVAALILGLLLWRHVRRDKPVLEWHAVDGRWTEANGIVSVLTYGRGDLQTAGEEGWRNYTLSADLRYDLLFPETHYGDAGLVVRVSNASEGVDSYQGYYAGIRADDQMLMFGRADFGWRELTKVHLPRPIRMGEWYHLSIDADECRFTVSVADSDAKASTLVYADPNCKRSGGVGLRSFYAQSSWKNISVRLR